MDRINLDFHFHYSYLHINYPSRGGWGKKYKTAPAIIGTETATTNSTNTDSSNGSNSTNSGIKAKADCVFMTIKKY